MAADVIIDPTNGQIYWNDGAGSPQSISIKGDAQNAISFVGYSASFSPGSTPAGALTLVTVNDNSGTAALVPGTNAYELGSGVYRWKFYGTTGNFSDSTISSSLLTGAVLVNGGIAISGNASIGQSLLLYGAGTAYTYYTGFKAGSVLTNTLYTLPLTYPSTGTSVLQSDTSGVMTWVPMTATSSSSSGGTVYAGLLYQVAFYSATGNTVGGSSTFINDTSLGTVKISHTTASTGTSTGALQVAGGVGISGRLSFNQSSFGTTGIATNPTMAMIGQTGDPIYLSILEDNSISFEGSQGQLFSISPNLTTGYIWAVNDISGVPLLRANVNGNVYISEFGGYLGIGQTNPTYKLDVKGNMGLASSNDGLYNFIFSNSAASGSNSLQIRSANSIQLYNSGNTFYTAFKSNASANVTYTLPATDGSSGQFLQTNGTGTLTWATATGGAGGGSSGVNPGGQYQIGYYAATGASIDGSSTFTNNTSTAVVSISHATASTNYTNGAFTVSGGVGIGGSLYVGGIGASISGVRFTSGAITGGAWNGTVIATQYGGTGQNLSSSSGILTISSGTVSASTTSSAIASALSDETGSGALVFATGPLLVNPDIGGATGSSLYLSASTASTTTTTGALKVPGGVGIGGSVSIGGYLQLFNGANYTSFVSSASASGSTIYTLPATSPSTGTSVLQSTSTGIMSWVPLVTSSSSGTVNSGTAGSVAVYLTNGTAVSGTNLITYAGSGVTIGGTINASSTTAASLVVVGGVGITGNAFIGGTTSIQSSQVSTSPISGALVVSGGVGIGGSLFLTTSLPSSLSGVVVNNGFITTGTWSGNVITSLYGGTGFNSYTVGDLLVASTGTSLAKLPASANTGYVLTSNGSGAVPSWQAVPPAAASSVAAIASTSNASFFITTVSGANVSGVGLSTVTSFVVNPSTGLVTVSGLAVTNLTNSASTITGAFTVLGGAGITGNAFIGGTINVGSSNPSVVSGVSLANGAITVGAWNATAISPQYGGTGQNYSGSSGILKYTAGTASLVTAPSGAIVGTTDSQNLTNKTYNGVTITAPATSATLTLADTTTLTTSGAFNLTLTTTALTNVTFPSGTKTLVATDVTSLASLTTASSLNSVGTITSGTWAGTVITSLYGGTGFNSYTVGDLLVASTGTSLAKLAASSNVGYVLTSTGSGSVPSWQAVPASSASSVAAIATTSNASFFITTVSGANVSGVGLSTITSFVINPSTGVVSLSGLAVTSLTQSTSSSTGALIVTAGASVGQTLSVGGSLNIFNGANYSGFKYAGTANTTYTLPPDSPKSATGTSVLTSNIAGVMSWIGMSAGGSGSPAGNNKQIQYNSSGSFAGASGFEYVSTGGIAVTVSVFSPSGTGYTSGLWINAIDGATTRVGIGLSNPAYELEINGEISATNKSFVIDHPTKSGMKLRYGSLEGPENGVYVRGELKNSNIIEVPDHWIGLVHPDSYTVHLTPIGRFAQLYVEKIENYNVFISDANMNPIHCYYSVWAERKDIPKLITEYEAQ